MTMNVIGDSKAIENWLRNCKNDSGATGTIIMFLLGLVALGLIPKLLA